MRWAGHVARMGERLAYTEFWWGNMRERDHLDDIRADGITYLLTPCSRVLLEKLNGSQLVKKFHAIFGTRRFITAFTRARHLSQSSSQLDPVHASSTFHFLKIQVNIILPSMPGSSLHLDREFPACNAVPQHSAQPRAPVQQPVSFDFLTSTAMYIAYSPLPKRRFHPNVF
jgi:hypothetical protein